MIVLFLALSSSIEIIVPNVNDLVPAQKYKGDSTITSVIISEGIRYISAEAFMSCNNLQTITFPSSLTSIKESAFRLCSSLVTLKLNEGLTFINHYAFHSCSSLQEISFPSTLEEFGVSMFYGCNNIDISKVYFPNEKSSVFFYENGGFYSHDKKYLYFVFCSIKNNNFLNEETEEIGNEAINGCGYISELTIPKNVKSLTNYMSIAGCSNLNTLYLGEKLETVESSALSSLFGLKKIIISNENPYIEVKNDVLYTKYLSNILFYPLGITSTSFTVPMNTSYIGPNTFIGNNYLSEFFVEEGNIHMKSYKGVLYSIDEKTLLKFPPNKELINSESDLLNVQNIEVLDHGSFADCKKISNLNLVDFKSLVEIGNLSFLYAKLPSRVILPASLKILHFEVFGFTKIEYCEFQNLASLEKIGKSEFMGCDKLVYFEFPTNPLIDTIPPSCLKLCKSLKNLKISENIKYIEKEAFQQDYDLSSIELPPNLIEIGSLAFESCTSLKYVEIPYSTKVVRTCAFLSCSEIEKAVFLSCNTEKEKDAFLGCKETIQVECKATKTFTSFARKEFAHLNSFKFFLFFQMIGIVLE